MKALFTFGRFQPPTIGHKVLIDFIVNKAAELDAEPFIYVSSKKNDMDKYLKSKKYNDMITKGYFESTDLNENPLPVTRKLYYLQKMFTDKASIFIQGTTIFAIIDTIKSKGYTDITMAVGSDRVETFHKLLTKVGVNVISAGERTVNTSLNAKAMSGTKMREAAVAADTVAFKRGVLVGSMTDEDAINLLNEVREGLGYKPLTEGGRRKHTIRIKKSKKSHKSRKYRLRLEERT